MRTREMVDDGKSGERGGRKDTGESSRSFHDPHSLFPLGVTKQNQSRGIVIHLTGTEGEWDSLEDDELIFPLDHSEEKPLPAEDDRGLKSQNFYVPLSPSSPGSPGNCSAAPPSFLSPGPPPASPRPSTGPRPPAGLVKSLSTELEPKDGSTLRPKPLLSLVKSISTELSHSEPEVSQSRSDSRLNLHLWKQLTQTKPGRGGDSRTAPPSPSAEGLRGGFFRVEDTKRKLSEAMHEPLSCMFSRILGEDGAGSPKQQGRAAAAQRGRDGGLDPVLDPVLPESPAGTARRPDGDVLPMLDWPSVGARPSGRPARRDARPAHRRRDTELEICQDDDTMQVFAIEAPSGAGRPPGAPAANTSGSGSDPQPPPRMSLLCVAVLSYGYFVLPVGPYVSGLALGLALGFLLGLFLVRLGSSGSAEAHRPAAVRFPGGSSAEPGAEPGALQGWMNEIQDYDPEIFHPALTHSVFATLQGCSLRLDYPRCNIRRRAARDDDPPQEVSFIKTRCFRLAESKVFLLPAALARKRVWNPKYPICIQVGAEEDGTGSEQNLGSDPAQTSSTQPGAAPPALYLFGRTGREKEEWFRRLLLASAIRDGPSPGWRSKRPADLCPPGTPSQSVPVPRSRGPSSSDDDSAAPATPATPTSSFGPALPCSTTGGLSALDYHSYMARLLAAHEATPPCSPGASSAEASPNTNTTCTCDQATPPGDGPTSWVNALIGRIFWDFLREKQWADAVAYKIQKKLSRIRLPYFMNELTLTELDMGCSMPHIMAASRPEVNHRGLWVQLQLVYTGNLQMTLQTKFNLTKLGKESREEMAQSGPEAGGPSCRPVLSVLADSDEESSSAASSDEEELLLSEPHCPSGDKGSVAPPEGAGGGRTGRKILRFVDKITKSKCFQRAAESEFIRRKFEDLSNTPLLLSVEVRELSGTLVVNIPAPPTDRIWYSFCVPPKLDLHVCPKLGQRELSFCPVSDWIEKKLQDEFQKVFVLPNMDDISVPLMHAGMDEFLSPCREDPAAAHR